MHNHLDECLQVAGHLTQVLLKNGVEGLLWAALDTRHVTHTTVDGAEDSRKSGQAHVAAVGLEGVAVRPTLCNTSAHETAGIVASDFLLLAVSPGVGETEGKQCLAHSRAPLIAEGGSVGNQTIVLSNGDGQKTEKNNGDALCHHHHGGGDNFVVWLVLWLAGWFDSSLIKSRLCKFHETMYSFNTFLSLLM